MKPLGREMRYLAEAMKNPPKKALIVGAGIAGIATSIRLRKLGYEVHVLEANDYPGGKLTAFDQEGFRFDAGPSLFTLPYLVDELFELCGENPREHFNYRGKEVACHYFWEDGTFLPAWTDRSRFAQEVEERLEVPAARLSRHLEHAQTLWDSTSTLFMERSLHRLETYLSRETLRAMVNLHRLNLLTTMHKANERALKHPKLTQLFDRYATYNGSSPYLAPGVMNIIPHLEHHLGTYYPEGGMHEITMSLVHLAERIGVRFNYQCPVERIRVEKNVAVGVEVASAREGQKFMSADLVVSNMDVVPTYRRLMAEQKAPEKTLAQPRSSSALIWYWGINRSFPGLDLHNIFFSEDYQREFDYIFEKGKVFEDPTVYVNISSKEDPKDAPEGMENWFVMVNVPGNTGQDWDLLIEQTRKAVLKKLSRMLGEDIESLITSESVLDPRSIESKTSSYQGSLYGAASNNSMAAFLRHPNFHRRIKGLYFAGGSAHPGGGIPLCLLSARITADLVEKIERP